MTLALPSLIRRCIWISVTVNTVWLALLPIELVFNLRVLNFGPGYVLFILSMSQFETDWQVTRACRRSENLKESTPLYWGEFYVGRIHLLDALCMPEYFKFIDLKMGGNQTVNNQTSQRLTIVTQNSHSLRIL